MQVQVVLYEDARERLASLIRAVGASVKVAKTEQLTWVGLAFGDCSAAPVYTEAEFAPHQEEGLSLGLDELTYSFYRENLGSAGGSNRLAERSSADAILILNPDAYPSPYAISRLASALSSSEVGIAEARQLPLEHPKSYHLVSGDTSWASGACMLVRRTAFEQVAGFDTEFFFLHGDDVDFSWRVRLAGHRVVHVPSAVVFHDKSLGDDGRPSVGAAEELHGVLGKLMLAHRYGRPDLVNEAISWIEAAGSRTQRQALEEYWRRRRSGRLPEATPRADEVAEFNDGEYAEHRF